MIFVDGAIAGVGQLVSGLLSKTGDGVQREIVVLDSARDGIEQISDFLSRYDELAAVHIISHGSDGGVQLPANELFDHRDRAIDEYHLAVRIRGSGVECVARFRIQRQRQLGGGCVRIAVLCWVQVDPSGLQVGGQQEATLEGFEDRASVVLFLCRSILHVRGSDVLASVLLRRRGLLSAGISGAHRIARAGT